MSNVNPYCTAQDVEDKLPRILKGITNPRSIIKEGKLTEECIRISSEMDTRFRAVGIDVPVDVSRSERVQRNLERVAVNGVAASILKSQFSPGERNYDLAELYEKQYYGDIASIEKNGLGLEDGDKQGIFNKDR